MAGKMSKKKTSHQKNNKKRVSSAEHDSFSERGEHKRHRRGDEYIPSDVDEEESGDESGREEPRRGEVEFEEFEETPAEKKYRLAQSFLETLREKERRREEDKDDIEGSDEEPRNREGERDSRITELLQQKQLEDSSRVRRSIASRVRKPATNEGCRLLVKHWQPVTAVAVSEDDTLGFSASKDGTIVHWDLDHGKTEKYHWPSDEVLKAHGFRGIQGVATKKKRNVLALAVSSDSRYLATGGLDRHVHLWDIRTRQHVQAFPGHKGPVSCLTFRLGTSELFSGSFDRSIKIWNADDRTYVNTLFGHKSEVLAIDSLRKERVLTVGRDREMHLWKVPEESQLIFRAPASSLECCCFINNDEFLTGSDDGSIEVWNVLRKKPVSVLKNVHVAFKEPKSRSTIPDELPNGHIEEDAQAPCKPSSALSWVSSVAVCNNSDLAASGAGNGSICLWAIEDQSRGIRPLFELPQVGFVNSLAFARSGKFLIAGVGKEPRVGRWGRTSACKNGVFLHTLDLEK